MVGCGARDRQSYPVLRQRSTLSRSLVPTNTLEKSRTPHKFKSDLLKWLTEKGLDPVRGFGVRSTPIHTLLGLSSSLIQECLGSDRGFGDRHVGRQIPPSLCDR